MSTDEKIRRAESELFSSYELTVDEAYVELPRVDVRLRVLSVGAGAAIVLLHGASLAAAAWTPLLPALAGYRAHLVELPGHGLSSPVTYRPGAVRDHTLVLMDDLLNALNLDTAPILGHSLGGMFALWYASERPDRIATLVAIGDPAVALPGVIVRMPLSLMTPRILGPLVLRAPTPRPLYRHLLGQGLSPAAAAVAPDTLLDVLRLSSRRPGNAKTVASLMHALNHFRRPRNTSVMSDTELRQITSPTMFIWGRGDPFLSPAQARPSIAKLPAATLHEVAGGHGSWFEDPTGCATLITQHLASTGYPPTLVGRT